MPRHHKSYQLFFALLNFCNWHWNHFEGISNTILYLEVPYPSRGNGEKMLTLAGLASMVVRVWKHTLLWFFKTPEIALSDCLERIDRAIKIEDLFFFSHYSVSKKPRKFATAN